MRTSPPRLFLAIVFLLIPLAASAQTYNAVLLGTNETSNCDPDGTGNATLVFNGNQVTYAIVVNNIVLPPTMQHIHIGAAGVDGGVEVNLPGTWVGNSLNGTTTADPAGTRPGTNPAGYYVNVHNNPCPGGAVRGQLVFASTSTSIPTFSTWTLLALIGVLSVAGIVAIRKF